MHPRIGAGHHGRPWSLFLGEPAEMRRRPASAVTGITLQYGCDDTSHLRGDILFGGRVVVAGMARTGKQHRCNANQADCFFHGVPSRGLQWGSAKGSVVPTYWSCGAGSSRRIGAWRQSCLDCWDARRFADLYYMCVSACVAGYLLWVSMADPAVLLCVPAFPCLVWCFFIAVYSKLRMNVVCMSLW